MLFSFDQMKHLVPDGEETYKFVPNGTVTKKEKQTILDMDADFFEINQQHLITNIEDVKAL